MGKAVVVGVGTDEPEYDDPEGDAEEDAETELEEELVEN